MEKTLKNSCKFVLFFVGVVCFSLALFCACGGKKTPQPEEPKIEATEMSVFWGERAIGDDETVIITTKANGTIVVELNSEEIGSYSQSEIDWSKLVAYYKTAESEENILLENLSEHTSVSVQGDDGEYQYMIGLPSLSKSGSYKFVISVGEIKKTFSVILEKESIIGELSLGFNANNKVEDGVYSFEYGKMRPQDYSVKVGNDYTQNYHYARITVSEFNENNGGEDIALSEIDVHELGYGVGTPKFEELDAGEYYVCVYLEEDGVENVYSKVFKLVITPSKTESETKPSSLNFTFNTFSDYSETITFNSILENSAYSLSVSVLDEAQSMNSGNLGSKMGTWELFSKENLTNFVATDGETVEEENILSLTDNLVAGNNKYVPILFNYNSGNYVDEVFLVKANLSKGQIVFPDIVYLGFEGNNEEVLTYVSDEQKLVLDYSNDFDVFKSYYVITESKNGLSGTTTLTVKNKDRYELDLLNATTLNEKIESNATNYKSVTKNLENGTVVIEWELSPILFSQTATYSITSTQQEEGGNVVSGDVSVVLNFNQRSNSTFLDGKSITNIFKIECNNEVVLESNIAVNGNQISFHKTITSFNDNNNVLNIKVSVNQDFENKVKFLIAENLTSNYKESTLMVEKFSLENKEVSYSGVFGDITLNSIKSLDYVKTLNNYYNITWKVENNAFNEDQSLPSQALVADLTPVNAFFVEEFNSDENVFTLFKDEEREVLVFEIKSLVKNLTPTFAHYVAEKTNENVVTKVEVQIDFDAVGLTTLVCGKDAMNNDIYLVSASLVEEDYCEIESVEVHELTMVITILVKSFSAEDYAPFKLALEVNPSYSNYRLTKNQENFAIAKISE